MAERISEVDREFLRLLANNGHRMIVLSCGTANLSEKILESAEIVNCFENIIGNRFETIDGRISDMTLHVPNPEDKVRYVIDQKMNPKACVAVGDGYTDIPLLDWAEISILVDRTGRKQIKYAHKNYRFVKSLTSILDII
jgi:phosphoserine phosphatase